MLDTRGLYPVAIGCTGGSGSRVLWDILETSPQIFMDRDYHENTKDSRKSKKILKFVDAPSETICRWLEKFMMTILDQIPAGEETRYQYFGWKTPRTVEYVDALFQVHPELRFLHLIRDPAAVARGGQQNKFYTRKKAKGKIDPNAERDEFILARWAKQNLPVWKKHKDNPRYLLVRYEEIINRPEQTIQRIFDWLGVTEYKMSEALAVITSPADAISRGDNVDVSMIAEAVQQLGYGHRL